MTSTDKTYVPDWNLFLEFVQDPLKYLSEKSPVSPHQAWNTIVFHFFSKQLKIYEKDNVLLDSRGKKLGEVLPQDDPHKSALISSLEGTDIPAILSALIDSSNVTFGYDIKYATLKLIGTGEVETSTLILSGYFFPMNIEFKLNDFETIRLIDCVFYSFCHISIEGKIRNIHFNNCRFHSAVNIFPHEDFYVSSLALAESEFFSRLSISGGSIADIFTMEQVVAYREVEISKIKFLGNVNFSSFQSKDALKFQSVIFDGNVPIFTMASLTHRTFWINCEWPPIHKRKIKSERTSYFNERVTEYNVSAIACYDNLVSIMSKLEKHHERHMFYRFSRRVRREYETNYFAKFIDYLYDRLSGYGYSVEKVGVFWVLCMIFGSIATFPAKHYTLSSPNEENLTTALNLWVDSTVISLSNLFGFLGLWRGPLKDFYATYPQESTYIPFALTWSLQLFVGFMIAFLFGLTLRNRFKIN